MNQTDLTQLLFAILPALIVGAVAFYFFYTQSKNEEQKRRFLLFKENQKTALPIRLQAYERMTLFLERISPGKILFRIKPNQNSSDAYEALLISTIEREFEHNLVQQIYLTNECWDYIRTAKNATIGIIRTINKQDSVNTAEELRQGILGFLLENKAPTDAAISFIKKEVKTLI